MEDYPANPQKLSIKLEDLNIASGQGSGTNNSLSMPLEEIGLIYEDKIYQKAKSSEVFKADDTDFTVKFEGGELPKIRRKVCRKIYSMLMEEFRVDKQIAKTATLNLEYRLNSVVDLNVKGEKAYLGFVKNVVQHIKVDLAHFEDFSVPGFPAEQVFKDVDTRV